MTAGTTERRQLVTFEAAGELFAADIGAVERVLRYEAPRLVPNAAGWLRGVISHGGSAVPVIDLRERLGLPLTAPNERTRILVVIVDGAKVGVVVDAVLAVRTVGADDVEPPPAIYRGLAREYLEGIARQDEQLFVVLATARLLTTTERIAMEQALTQGSHDG